jgi:hypothetical protein
VEVFEVKAGRTSTKENLHVALFLKILLMLKEMFLASCVPNRQRVSMYTRYFTEAGNKTIFKFPKDINEFLIKMEDVFNDFPDKRTYLLNSHFIVSLEGNFEIAHGSLIVKRDKLNYVSIAMAKIESVTVEQASTYVNLTAHLKIGDKIEILFS